ncbi:unnamed protein product, partial [Pelagomonas calceolata]
KYKLTLDTKQTHSAQLSLGGDRWRDGRARRPIGDGRRVRVLEADRRQEPPRGVVPDALDGVLRGPVVAVRRAHVGQHRRHVDVDGRLRRREERESGRHGDELARDGVERRRVDQLNGLRRRVQGRRRRAHGQALVVRVADGHDLARPRAARVLAVEEGLGHVRKSRGLPADAPARVQVLVAPRRHDPQVLEQRHDARQELLRREADPVLVGVRDNHDLAVQRLGALQQGFDAVLQAPEALGVGVRRRVHALGRRRDPRRRAERVVVVEDHEPVGYSERIIFFGSSAEPAGNDFGRNRCNGRRSAPQAVPAIIERHRRIF